MRTAFAFVTPLKGGKLNRQYAMDKGRFDDAVIPLQASVVYRLKGDYQLYLEIYRHLTNPGAPIPMRAGNEAYASVKDALDVRNAHILDRARTIVNEEIRSCGPDEREAKKRNRDVDIHTMEQSITREQEHDLKAVFSVYNAQNP
jgi:hypothetical protein